MENKVTRIDSCRLPTKYGEFQMIGFLDKNKQQEHIALVLGDIANSPDTVLVRIHSECMTGDSFHSLRCDCGAQLAEAMQKIQAAKKGIIIYLRQEGRGIGLLNKIKAYHLQDDGMDTVEANLALGLPVDCRDFSIAADILKQLNVKNINLMTNNPEKINILKQAGINIEERLPIFAGVCRENENYLKTKINKMGHLTVSGNLK